MKKSQKPRNLENIKHWPEKLHFPLAPLKLTSLLDTQTHTHTFFKNRNTTTALTILTSPGEKKKCVLSPYCAAYLKMCGFFHIIWWHFTQFNFCSFLLDPTFFSPHKHSTNGISCIIWHWTHIPSHPFTRICIAAAQLPCDVPVCSTAASWSERRGAEMFHCEEKQNSWGRGQPETSYEGKLVATRKA